MATWQEIGQDNFRAGRELYQRGRYRSSVSRFYYSVFSSLTHELISAGVIFGEGHEAPTHKELPKLVNIHLSLATAQKADSIAIIRRVYATRITADYQRRTIDEAITREVMRDTAKLFRYLKVEYD